VPYFHVVFTLPDTLHALALQNTRLIYTLLFRTVAETLLTIAREPTHLGAHIGFLAILPTWGQQLQYHPHLHCVVPGGGLAPDGTSWVPCAPRFLLPVRVLSRFFRRRCLAGLTQAATTQTLTLTGPCQALPIHQPGNALCRSCASTRGRLREASPARAGTRAQVPRPLHPSRGDRQPAAPRLGGGQGHLSLAGFRPRDWPAGDDLGRGRIPPALSPPRLAARVPTHPTLWLPGQPYTAGATHAVSPAAAASRCLVVSHRARDRHAEATAAALPSAEICPVCQTGRMLVIETLFPHWAVWDPRIPVLDTS
jgi:Putative transposase